jgi:hypothetical protein
LTSSANRTHCAACRLHSSTLDIRPSRDHAAGGAADMSCFLFRFIYRGGVQFCIPRSVTPMDDAFRSRKTIHVGLPAESIFRHKLGESIMLFT